MALAVLNAINNVRIKIRQKVEEFKDDHKMASKAISEIIDNLLPQPYKTLCGIFWEGIEKEDRSAEKIIQLLEKLERTGDSNEKLLTETGNKISEILKRGATRQEIQQLADQMRTSNQSLINILNSHTERFDQIDNEVEKVRKQIANDEVTYSTVEFGCKDVHAILEDIASAINVEVDEKGNQFSAIPFIPFNGFYDLKHKNKIFLYGKSGCGKSRSIIELIRDKITNFQIHKVYIIHPRDSRKNSSRISISELGDNLKESDIVI